MLMNRTRLASFCLALPPVLLATALLGPVLFAPNGYAPATCDDDFYMYYLPMAEVAFGMWREGTLPLWNPYLYSGMPLLASIEIGVLYPPNWLHLIVAPERAFCLLYIAHIGLAAGGAWWYARQRGLSREAALFAAISFSFAAPAILHQDKGMTSIVYSAAWFPAILAMVDRVLSRRTTADVCGLALMLACQFLAGFPLFTLCLAWVLVGYLSTFAMNWKQPFSQANGMVLMLFVCAAGLALGLVTPQLLSTLDYLSQSRRSELSYAQSTHASLPTPNLITLLVPGFFGNDRSCPYWGEAIFADSVIFCGTTSLVLVTMCRRHHQRKEVLFWLVLVVLVLGVALGDGSALYDLCFLYVPGVSRFRGVSRLSIFAVFGISMLAAYGLDALKSLPPSQSRSWFFGGLGALTAVILAWTVVQSFGSSTPGFWHDTFAWVRAPGTELMIQFPPEAIPALKQQSYRAMLHSVGWSAAVIAIACTVLVVVNSRPALRIVAGPLLISMLCFELYGFDRQYVVLMDSAPWKAIARQAQSALPKEEAPYRIAGFSLDPPLLPNRFLYTRLPSTGGHENFVLERYSIFVELIAGIEPEWQAYLSIPNHDNIYNLLNVRYFFSPADEPFLQPADQLVQERVFDYRHRSYSLYRNPTALPRAVLIHQAKQVDNIEDAARGLIDLAKGTIERDTVIEGDPGVLLNAISSVDRAKESAVVTDHSPGHVIVDLHCTAPAVLLYLGNYARGWKATVDGRPVAVLPANVWMRAVPVPAGAKRVEMIYAPETFRWGMVIAVIAATLTMTGLLLPMIRPLKRFEGQIRTMRF